MLLIEMFTTCLPALVDPCGSLVLGVRPFVRQGVVRQLAVRCKWLDEREPVVSEWAWRGKRRRALLESNPPRDTSLKLIPMSGRGGSGVCPGKILALQTIGRDFPMPRKTHACRQPHSCIFAEFLPLLELNR